LACPCRSPSCVGNSGEYFVIKSLFHVKIGSVSVQDPNLKWHGDPNLKHHKKRTGREYRHRTLRSLEKRDFYWII
jgi:hypothetical protein